MLQKCLLFHQHPLSEHCYDRVLSRARDFGQQAFQLRSSRVRQEKGYIGSLEDACNNASATGKVHVLSLPTWGSACGYTPTSFPSWRALWYPRTESATLVSIPTHGHHHGVIRR